MILYLVKLFFLPLLLLVILLQVILRLERSDANFGIAKNDFRLLILFIFCVVISIFNIFLIHVEDLLRYRYIIVYGIIIAYIYAGRNSDNNLRFLMISILNIVFVLNFIFIGIEYSVYFVYDFAGLQDLYLLAFDGDSSVISRKMIGIWFLRPRGLLGDVHASSFLLMVSFLFYFYKYESRLTFALKLFLLMILLFFVLIMQNGQTIILTFVSLLIYLFYRSNKVAIGVVSIISIIIVYFWARIMGHLDSVEIGKQGTMLAVYLESFSLLSDFPFKSCFIFGCFFDHIDIEKILFSIHNLKENIEYTDSGFIPFLMNFGIFFPFLFIYWILKHIKVNRDKRFAIDSKSPVFMYKLTALSVTILSIIHYPIGFGLMNLALTIVSLQVSEEFQYRKD